MARLPEERENLIAEATALVERVEFRCGEAESMVAGFRADGAASLFFGVDPVYQFNARGELRRAFVAGQLLKAQSGALVEMTRTRAGGQVQLVARKLAPAEQQTLLTELARRLRDLETALATTAPHVEAEVPAGSDVVGRLRQWLAELGEIKVANAPNAR
jgi:hypothetical protein